MALLDDVIKEDFKPAPEKVELIPANYEKNSHGIFKVSFADKSGKAEKNLIPLSYTAFDITTRLENPDTKEVFYEISFNGKQVIISGGELSNKKGMVKLAGYGVNTIESNAKELTKFIMEMINLNNIPASLIYDRMGWKDDGSYVLGKVRYTKDGCAPSALTTASKQIEAVHQRGTLAGWVNAVALLMKHSPQRFKMYIGTLAPLLKPLDEQNICLNDYGDTAIGKTKTTEGSLSMFGDPVNLVFSGNSTQVGMERMVTLFGDMPINLDDTQMVEKKTLETIIYMIGNGVGKLRGAKEGGTQEVPQWRTAGLFTSEIPIITDESKGGLGARLVEISKGLGKQDYKAIQVFETEIKLHHGVFAPILINYIIQNKKEIKELHEASKKTLLEERGHYVFDNAASGIAGRLANTFSAILTAGKVFEKLYKDAGGEYENPEPIVLDVFKRTVEKQGAETYTARGMHHILSWTAANKTNFLENGVREYDNEGKVKRYKIFGDITPTHYYLIPSELKAELDKAKFSTERLIGDFFEAGYLEIDKEQKQRRNQKTHKIEGTAVKTYALIRERVDINDPDSEKQVK